MDLIAFIPFDLTSLYSFPNAPGNHNDDDNVIVRFDTLNSCTTNTIIVGFII